MEKSRTIFSLFLGLLIFNQMSVLANISIQKDEAVIPKESNNDVDYELLQALLYDYVDRLVMGDNDIFILPTVSVDIDLIVNAVNLISTYLNTEITYQVGEDIILDQSIISDWIVIDNELNVCLDDELINIWLDAFIDQVNTHGKIRKLTTPWGREVTVTGGYYGWRVDKDLELETLMDHINNGDILKREPKWKQSAQSYGAKDWGDHYIQVDMKEQYMWVFVDKDVVLESPVVTGLPKDGRDTPEGVYFVLEKLSPKTLTGETDSNTGNPIYISKASYWMRMTWEGHGIHDAVWQPAFGGKHYRKNGSHGCINLPLDVAARLYDISYIHMPIVVHY